MVTLLPRKKFEINLSSGVIEGQFGTWAFKRFCDRQGIKLSQIGERMEAFTTEHDISVVVDFLLSAVEQPFREKGGTGFPHNDANACAWIDEMGGFDGAEFIKLLNHAGDEKKSEMTAAAPLNGETSPELQQVPA